ncbi:MAG: flavodoxin family protein [Candidatus Glassbacteria bacterium]
MKVLCIQGSPRKNGNTATVLGWVEQELNSRGHAVEHLEIAGYGLEGCVGCYKCQLDPAELTCSRQDRGLEVFESMKEADAVIYATPLYCWGFSSQIKPFIDRHLCLSTGYGDPRTHRSHVDGKRVGLLVTAAGQEGKGNSDLIVEVFERLADYVKTDVVARLIVPSCTEPGDLGEKQRKKARAFAEAIAG